MRIVVALGGNALLQRGQILSANNQSDNIIIAAQTLAPLALQHQLIICHGNGPQVGLLQLENENYHDVPTYPLDILVAETQAMIGYPLQQALGSLVNSSIATLITQVEVDKNDPAMLNPTKMIGPVYTKSEAKKLQQQNHWVMKVDGQSMRRVVPSPLPKSIIEIDLIRALLAQNTIVICAGGGGIPVYKENHAYKGVQAVIDKDHTAALLADTLQADILLILTDVEAVYENWKEPENKHAIKSVTVTEIKKRTFDSGSMAPKIAAACDFVSQSNGFAIIGHLSQAAEMLQGTSGTKIVKHMQSNHIIFY
ncbi:carbamate kinase [uncultured Shewanella sp.]|uniref:carbamate kinase n=1 Tax=uncultured Shewanella sp. TaxID=173975 RepID=UPI00262B13D3|nr:carbamate kinase [uncultured Shewanella sp.]